MNESSRMRNSSPEFEPVAIPARIGLVADTHRPSGSRLGLPAEMLRGLDGCDLILHAGDLNSLDVIEQLGRIAPVAAVYGNNDEPGTIAALPLTRFFSAGVHKLGLIHGHIPGRTARQSAIQVMEGVVDCAVYGHSHIPDVSMENGLLLVNPGSPTQRRWGPHRCYAIMSIDEEIDVEIVRLNEVEER